MNIIIVLLIAVAGVNACAIGIIGLIISILNRPKLKRRYNAPKKLTAIKKLFFDDLNSAEYYTLCKIKYNMPELKSDYGQYLTLLKNAGYNIEFPLYKISMLGGYNKNCLKKELGILRKLEEYGYAVNIAINFDSKKFDYKELLYIAREQSFVSSIVKIYNTNDVELKLLWALNMFNINYMCVTKKALFDTKHVGCSVDIANVRYNFFDESYIDFVYKSQVNANNFVVASSRTFDYKKAFALQRFNFINLAKHKQSVVFNMYIPFSVDDKKSCYFSFAHTSKSFTLTNLITNKTITYTSNLPIFTKAVVTKQGVCINYKITKQTYLFVGTCYDSVVCLPDFVKGEELFVSAKECYKQLSPIKVFTSSPTLNKLINTLLPNRIVASVIYDPSRHYDNFVKFANNISVCPQNMSILCHKYLCLKNLFVNSASCVVDYYALIYMYLGLYFTQSAIYFNPYKRYILTNSKLQYFKNNHTCEVDVVNNTNDATSFVINNVEYSNIKFIKYSQLTNKLVLQF